MLYRDTTMSPVHTLLHAANARLVAFPELKNVAFMTSNHSRLLRAVPVRER